MFMVGMRPGEVYSESRALKGACPSVGTTGMDGSGRVFIMLKVGASQNLTQGLAVVYSTTTYATILGTAAAAGVPNLGPVAIIYASITASTSQLVWAQIYGLCTTAVFEASGSALPGAAVKFGANGALTSVAITTASAYIAGCNCAATNSVVTTAVSSIFLNYPKAIGG